MNDKEIRKILISYLKASSGEIRIYQEKSIGSSICDVMAVTDCLTGYEIKSDVDNYQRLSSQIKLYCSKHKTQEFSCRKSTGKLGYFMY